MEKLQKDAINDENDYIVKEMNDVSLREVMRKLFTLGIIGEEGYQSIETKATPRLQTTELLRQLNNVEDKDTFNRFLEILIVAKKTHIAEKILERYKELGGENLIDLVATKKHLDKNGWERKSAVQLVKVSKKEAASASAESNPYAGPAGRIPKKET